MADRTQILEHLAEAQRHVTESERHLFEQRERIARLEREGNDTTEANRLLNKIEDVLRRHAADLERIRVQLAAEATGDTAS
jgi:hypothetical protein